MDIEIDWDKVARRMKANKENEILQESDNLAKALRQLADKVQVLEDREN